MNAFFCTRCGTRIVAPGICENCTSGGVALFAPPQDEAPPPVLDVSKAEGASAEGASAEGAKAEGETKGKKPNK